MADTPLGSGGRSRRRSTSPAPVSDLLQQLRALGLNQGRGTKTYAGLAAAGRSGSGATDLGRGGGSYRSSRPGPSSAFFKGTGDVGGKVSAAWACR